jgi:hypothetical protein
MGAVMFRRGVIALTALGIAFVSAPNGSGFQQSPPLENSKGRPEVPAVPELAEPPQISQPTPPVSKQPEPPPLEVLPLPLASPTAIRPGLMADTLSPQGKVQHALRNMFGVRSFANRVLLSGIDHWRDDPAEWSGNMDGYGWRLADRMGSLVIRNAVQVSADVAFGTEPRYDRCDCEGFWPRTRHALRRVFVSRKDSGGEMISVSRLAGAYVTPMITDQWMPASQNTWAHKLESGSAFLGWRGLSNIVKEFWPDISRKLRIKPEWAGGQD